MREIHTMAGHLIRRLNQISVGVFTDRMTDLGVDISPVQFAALVEMRAHPGIDQATLAGAIAYDKATLGKVIDKLEERGLLTRAISTRDRRARTLTISEKGERLLDTVFPEIEAFQVDILSGLSELERDTLLSLLEKTTTAGNEKSRAPLRTVPRDHQPQA